MKKKHKTTEKTDPNHDHIDHSSHYLMLMKMVHWWDSNPTISCSVCFFFL